ncbi:uncharacterized protein LOC129216761 [Uloborus diversus]|uniref:uncharacterized protein LOC129216761 n=1 Tax=Uloborus diversus TaxID=327109 RepID=UPI00240968C4|nr:uncharacterized protein LOC129216761 [Uloborus diversus]
MEKSCLLQRKVLRSAVTRTITELDNCFTANDVQSASLAYAKLEEKTKRLFENDEFVISYLSSNPDSNAEPDKIVENELEQIENYRDNFTSAKVRYQDFLKTFENPVQQERNVPPSTERLSINLPKLQLTEFDGNIKQWFSFWSMFQKIDEDPKIEDDVKFAYLMQTTKGKAFDFVQSYQVSKSDYKVVIKNLKARFADDKMLIELYVRELLKLVLNQSQNLSFTNLVDQLDTHLRCLENLGVTKEKYACMLYPLVEASIPEQILIAWERERNSISRNKTNSVTSNSSSGSTDVLLQTLRIKVSGPSKTKIVRCLCDSASQRSYVNRKLAEFLNSKSDHSEFLKHSLFGGVETEKIQHSAFKCELQEIRGNFSCEAMLLDKDIICGKIPKISKSDAEYFTKNGIFLSDVETDDSEISVLLGADYLGKILTGSISQQPNGLTAVQTYLGWVVMGKSVSDATCSNYVMPIISLLNASKICDLWSLDVLGIRDPVENKTKKDIDDETVSFFEKTVKFCDNRYEVNLPWVEGHPELLDLRFQAEKRLKNMSSKLISSGKFDSYDKILKEWEQLGIIEQVPSSVNGENLSEQRCRYLPHRAVFKESSLTTKIRPVFDASAKDENSVSLNQCLATGPNYIEMFPSILNKFRKDRLGVISDIRKAFLQISISPTDRDFLRFLWWKDYEKREIETYRHCRVVFGLSSSLFLLMSTIYHHLDKESSNEVAVKLKDSFYVDNVVASVQNEIELQQFRTTACQIMSKAGFELTGWVFSSKYQNGEKTKCSVLGLLWDPSADLISCDLGNVSTEINDSCSKRQLLSISQKIFDPIGFTAPVTLIPKLLMQKAWKNYKLTWDQKLAPEIIEEFKNWLASLKFLELIQIPRYFGGLVDESTTTMHMFSDASGKAFAACVFLRIECGNEVQIKLVQAKSRVAPLKKDPVTKMKTEMSIPKLELLAAVIGTRLVQNVKTSLNIQNIQTFYWTDSKVVLCWIKNSGTWKTFVRNRVKEIHLSSSKEEWNFVPSQMNIADIASRGCNAQTLFSLCWWEGPIWLKNRACWPDTQDFDLSDGLELASREKIPTVTTNITLNDLESNFLEWSKRISRFSTIIRILAYVKRFIYNIKSAVHGKRNNLLRGHLSREELSKSELEIFRLIQKETFVKNHRLIPANFVVNFDSDGLLRVETKLYSTDNEDYFRKPILLPDKHELVCKLIEDTHRTYNHAGVQTLVSILREKYWILRSRRTVRSVVSKCVICQRFKSKHATSVFAPLPENRVRMSAVFETTGVHMAGPLLLRNRDKVWIAIFTCAVYRAVHFELVSDISTQSFLLALRRFIARRGRVTTIYSDNGKNFVGLNNELQNIDWSVIISHSDLKKISWHFNPPTAAWWGGWWERVVRMLKELLRRNVGKACLQYDELHTVVCECEALLNSRPLTYLSEDPSDLVAITPSLFLQDQTEFCVEDLEQNDLRNLRKRARHLHAVKQKLKIRFQKEYLSILRQTSKGVQTPLAVGDIVLISLDNKKRVDWPLAKIIEIYKGRDGVSRVARLRTQSGELIRPFQRLYRLETSGKISEIMREPITTRSGRIVKPTTH